MIAAVQYPVDGGRQHQIMKLSQLKNDGAVLVFIDSDERVIDWKNYRLSSHRTLMLLFKAAYIWKLFNSDINTGADGL